jgi:hypothetical protein
MTEKQFAGREIKRLLKSHSSGSAANAELAGKQLYTEIRLLTDQDDEAYANVDHYLVL